MGIDDDTVLFVGRSITAEMIDKLLSIAPWTALDLERKTTQIYFHRRTECHATTVNRELYWRFRSEEDK